MKYVKFGRAALSPRVGGEIPTYNRVTDFFVSLLAFHVKCLLRSSWQWRIPFRLIRNVYVYSFVICYAVDFHAVIIFTRDRTQIPCWLTSSYFQLHHWTRSPTLMLQLCSMWHVLYSLNTTAHHRVFPAPVPVNTFIVKETRAWHLKWI
jgi:hypothetical protein